jgi:bla regulator protein blaR1
VTPLDAFLVRFLLASMASVAAGLATWSLCLLLRRWLPAMAMQRMGWLLAQLTVVAALAIALVPQQRVHLLPPVDIEAVEATVTHYIEPAAQRAAAAPGAAAAASGYTAPWLVQAARLWFGAYALGLAWHGLRLGQAQRLVRQLAAAGVPVTDASPLPVIEVAATVPPMLLGLFKPRLLVPRHLRTFDPVQQRLIVEHELAHWRRRDLHWMVASILLQTLLWFNPFMRLLRANLLWAQELGCDRDVLRGRPVAERKAYAAALVAQLTWQCVPVDGALAFGGVNTRTVKARIALIRTPPGAAGMRHPARVRCAALAALAAAACGSYALQPALAWQGDGTGGAIVQCTALLDAATGHALLRQGQCGARVTPASTFNIAVSLMGYDSRILQDEHTPRLPYREGYPAWIASWRASTDPTEWIHNSTVWYAQQVAAQVGAPAFQRYLDRFAYGNRDSTGDAGQEQGLRLSWVNSSLKISADEQAVFLRRLVNRELGLAPHAYEMTARLLKVRTLANGWDIYGKTGTGAPVGADGKDDPAHAYGWFVGWAVKGGRTVVFAHLVQDRHEQEDAAGPRARDAFLRGLPARLDAL